MIRLIKQELSDVGRFMRDNWRETALVSFAVLFLILNKYNPIGPAWVSSFAYFAVLPVLTIIILRANPLDFGLRLGNIKVWSLHVAVVLVVAPLILYAASWHPEIAKYYTEKQFDLLPYCLETGVYLFAWEFLFRGYLLFSLKQKLGETSIIVQMVPFAVMHMGKPEIETISTVITGLYFGYVAYRGNSFWPAFIMHLFINIVAMVFVNLR